MKLLLISLLSTTLASVTGQSSAPEMAVFYVNEKASPTACTSAQLSYINSQMLPDITATFVENDYVTPDWSITSATTTVDTVNTLSANSFSLDSSSTSSATTGSSNCDFCRRLYPRSLCNGMFNCGFRRQLRLSEARKLARDAILEAGLIDDCQSKLKVLAYSTSLSRTCRSAIKSAICQVVFI